MKLRGLPVFILALIVVGSSLGVMQYLKNKNYLSSHIPSDDMKRQLTGQMEALAKRNAENFKSSGMVERVDFNDNVLVQERVYTEAEITNMTASEFDLLLKDTELKLPKISDIKNIPEGALQRTPAPVMQAGMDLKLIKEILNAHESYTGSASTFFESCAKNNDRPDTIRAVCLTHLINIKKENGQEIKLSSYPKGLIELTKMVTEL